MYLHEEPVTSGSGGCTGQRDNELALSGRGRPCPAGQLYAMRGIEDDRVAEPTHEREGAHVDHEIVEAEGRPPFGQDDLVRAALLELVHDVPHIPGRQELTFLDVHDATCLGRRDQEIGLAAQERRDLQNVGALGGDFGFLGPVDVRQHGNTDLFPYLPQHGHAGSDARSTE